MRINANQWLIVFSRPSRFRDRLASVCRRMSSVVCRLRRMYCG